MVVKVFVVDDSAVVRQALAHMLADNPEIELIGSAPNPLLAMEAIRKNPPDVLLLDIEMPGMDGLTFLRQIMAGTPIPTVICSTLSTEGSRVALDALAAGAVAVLAKPKLGLKQHLDDSRHEMIQTLKSAARARPRVRAFCYHISSYSFSIPTSAAVQIGRAPALGGVHAFAMNKPVVIGSSTGGTQALELVLTSLPADAPGIAITQHMPEKFTAMYASVSTVSAP
jgi:two-component system chemotaxis response regulator CheB